MGRRFAARAKIIRRVHQAAAKEVLPDMVHRDTRRERIGGVDDPARQVEAIG